jgi:hypothetical protein
MLGFGGFSAEQLRKAVLQLRNLLKASKQAMCNFERQQRAGDLRAKRPPSEAS